MRQRTGFSEPTTLAGYTQAIALALETAGVDPVEVLREARVEQVRSNDPMLRITDSDINAIYERAVAATCDPYFGLRVASYILPGMLHALGYALLASETLEDFCRRVVRYWNLVAQSANYSVVDDGVALKLEAQVRSASLCFETEDTFAALVLRLMRMACQHELCALRLELRRPMPAGGDSPYQVYFGCPVQFGAASLCFYFDLATMLQPLPGASRELAQYNDQIVLRYLEKLDHDDIVSRVRGHIVAGLGAGRFSRADIAARLHMSASTLQGKLARAGLSFQQLLDETRHEIALGYIEQSRLSITEIAFMLGFSDLSNFIRAFKRWTGKSPTEYRSQGHQVARAPLKARRQF